MFCSHGLVSSIQITVLLETDHMTPSGREPLPLTVAISVRARVRVRVRVRVRGSGPPYS